MDIVITEIEQGPRTSVLDIKVNTVGSSVGSSLFIGFSLRDLARRRSKGSHIVKVEEQPRRGQMLAGFLTSADESPELLDTRFAGQKAIDLEQFAPICDTLLDRSYDAHEEADTEIIIVLVRQFPRNCSCRPAT